MIDVKGSKCPNCPNCPYYEQHTSYGTEVIRCANADCVLYHYYIYKEESAKLEEEEEK